MTFAEVHREGVPTFFEVSAPWLDEPVYAATYYQAYWLAVAARPRA